MARDPEEILAEDLLAEEMARNPDAHFCLYQGCGRMYDPAESTAPRPNDWCSAECQRLSFKK
jgi:hypothetical protein